ncbi:right-handed parallel beta-helix repeat-containing protein [Inquilinus sp. Marseille-Q2685]|uniref:right-handed parallel beta-helix repeat-containing protein n=1 Tax=Inquilinus sp. Marseille-Q2685 TaxID=2866581 RepID=UPI001CE428B1|nr:right-handed parallel beta-helix repeat-containing protein [Inquilinus sp. Marseille-Q2685]
MLEFDTRSQAASAAIDPSVLFLKLNGYGTPVDGGGGKYRKVEPNPGHAGAFQSLDGAWWELTEQVINPTMFGAAGGGTTDDTAALLNCLISPVTTAVQIPADKTYLATEDICTARTFVGVATNNSTEITGITRITIDIPIGSVVSLLDATTRQPVAFADGSYEATTTTGFILTSTPPAPPVYKITLNKALPLQPSYRGTVVAYVVADYARGPVSISGGGTIKLSNGKRIRVATPRTKISGLTIDANDAEFAIAVELPGEGAIIEGNHFYGGVGNYVSVFAPNVTINGNVMDGTSSVGVGTPIAMGSYNAFGCVVTGNTIRSWRGFGIQTRHAKNVTITGNSLHGDTLLSYIDPTAAPNTGDGPRVGNGSTNTFTFKFRDGFLQPAPCPRRAILVNDVPFAVTGVTIVDTSGGNETDWEVTFAVPPAPGTTLRMIGWRGLEPININSDSFNVSVTGNTILGSGDSGVVIADDEASPIPPERVTVANNVIEGCKGAAVAMTHHAKQISIMGNTCKDWGWGQDSVADAVYTAGIVATGDSVTVMGNTLVSNQGASAGSIKSTRAGITWNGFANGTPNLSLDNDPGDGDALLKFGGNIFMGTFPLGKYYIPNSSSDRRKFSGIITDAPIMPWTFIDSDASFTTKPANTSFLTYGGTSGTAWSYDTTNIIGGVGSIAITGTAGADSFVNVSPNAATNAAQALWNQILIVDFWAKATSGTLYFSTFSTINGATKRVRTNITSSTWKHYTQRMPITNAAQRDSLFFRVGANANVPNPPNPDTVSAGFFQHIKFSIQTIPT